MKSRFTWNITPSDTPNPTEKWENTVAYPKTYFNSTILVYVFCPYINSKCLITQAPVLNSVQYYTIIHSFSYINASNIARCLINCTDKVVTQDIVVAEIFKTKC